MAMFESGVYKSAVLMVVILACSAIAVEKPKSLSESCITSECHADYSKKKYVHGPVSLGDCKSCHKPLEVEAHTWQFTRKGKDLCEYCHLEQTAGKNVHEPLKKGDCTECHDAHSSDNKSLMSEKTVALLCQKCHDTGKGLKFLHGPVAVGECTICHESHSSEHENLLTNKPAELCFSCHVVTKNELTEFEFVHEPASNDCVGCHSGHGGDNAMMLKAKAPELCYSCHEDIKKIAEESKYQHSVVTKEGGCMHCHTPHASTVKFGLKDDPMALCMSCHDKPVKISEEKVLGAFTDEIKDKKFLHGPVAQKDCKGCHISHGSDHFRLLVKEYPPQFYAPFSKENYELCFSCHAESLVLEKETTKLTDFRNGNVNLHYLHVNKSQRGRTCRSCHATHGSDLSKHIRASVPYGMWELPIGFEKNETGGSCKPGCHTPFAYDRKSPVAYNKPQLRAKTPSLRDRQEVE